MCAGAKAGAGVGAGVRVGPGLHTRWMETPLMLPSAAGKGAAAEAPGDAASVVDEKLATTCFIAVE